MVTTAPLRRSVAATVLAKRAMDAEALSTALLVMGSERALAFADRRAVAVRLVVRQGSGHGERLSAALQALL